jgi:two-component system, sensor histidine kinase and response regulator
LVADDNAVNQKVAVAILGKLGLHADAVGNGMEAIRALETIPYDLVLMDVRMPELSGLDATQQIRSAQSRVQNHRVPIVALTAYATQQDRDECLASGMDDYISKPVTPRDLSAVIERWLYANPSPLPQVTAPAQDISPPATPVFNLSALNERLMGDNLLIRTVVAAFLEDFPHQLSKLQTYLETLNLPNAERQAHTIKGAAANVGCDALCRVAWEIEQAGREGDLQAIVKRMPDLKEQFERVCEATKEVTSQN